MSGSNLTAPANAAVLDAMMNDLGNHRIEELVHDDDRQSRQSLAPIFNISGIIKSTQSRSGGPQYDSPAQDWNAAVEDGFNDDDAAGVSGLDPLNNGNTHRLSSGLSRSDKKRTFDTHQVSKRPKYDPSQPTYRKRTSKVCGSPQVSSLGGIVPDGGEVRRWDSGRQLNATHHIHNPILNLPAGRGRLMSGQEDSPLGQPAQTASRGHGRGGRLPNPLHIDGDSRGAPTQQPQKVVGQDRGIAGPRAPEATESPVHDASWVPPHLRGTSGGRSPASQSPVPTRQASPRVNDQIPTLDRREVFLREDISILPQCGTKKPARGTILVYELLDTPVGIWELISEDEKKTIRGDLRILLEVLCDGSRSFLRRVHERRVVSTPLRFSTIDKAKNFMNEVNIRRDQFSRSSEAVYSESTIEWPVQNGVAHSTTSEATENATHKTAVKSAETSRQNATELRFDLPQSRNPEPENQNSQENGPTRPATELGQHNAKPRPHTPPILLPTEVTSTPTRMAAGSHVRNESGGSDNNLISFSPDKDNPPSRSDDLLQRIPVNYSGLKRMCSLLSHTFKIPHPLHSNPTYMASFLHLLERDEFMAQSPDDRKRSVEALYNNIGGKNARIILSPEVLDALRSDKEACPEAIKQLNDLIKTGTGTGNREHPRDPVTSRSSTHTLRTTMENNNAGNLGLNGPSARDSSVQQLSEGVSTVTSRPASRGLMGSRWAQDSPEGMERQSTIRGENIPTRNPSASPSLDGTDNEPERTVDREASGHRRSSTNDTITDLADQLGLLRV